MWIQKARDYAGTSWKHSLVTILLALCLVIVTYLWLRVPSQTGSTSTPGPATIANTPDRVERKVPTRKAPPPKEILYMDRGALVATLKMPELNFAPTANPIAVTEVAPHGGKTTVVAVLDNTTGQGSMITRQEKAPFFDLKREFQLSARYLFVGVNQVEADLVANPIRIGPVELEGGVGMEIRREDSTLGARGWVGFSYKF